MTLLDDDRDMRTVPLKIFHCEVVSTGAVDFYVAAEDQREARRHAEELANDVDDWGYDHDVEWIRETRIEDIHRTEKVWVGGERGDWIDDLAELPRRPRVFEGQERLDL